MRLSSTCTDRALGSGETFYDPMRRMFGKLRHDHTSANPSTILNVAMKAINGNVKEDVLVPSPHVREIIPRFPILNIKLPFQKKE